jgi:hypothetical protein
MLRLRTEPDAFRQSRDPAILAGVVSTFIIALEDMVRIFYHKIFQIVEFQSYYCRQKTSSKTYQVTLFMAGSNFLESTIPHVLGRWHTFITYTFKFSDFLIKLFQQPVS